MLNVLAMLGMKRAKIFAYVHILWGNREISSLNIYKMCFFFQNSMLGHSIHFHDISLEKTKKAAQHFYICAYICILCYNSEYSILPIRNTERILFSINVIQPKFLLSTKVPTNYFKCWNGYDSGLLVTFIQQLVHECVMFHYLESQYI